jgi:hypothetical protein
MSSTNANLHAQRDRRYADTIEDIARTRRVMRRLFLVAGALALADAAYFAWQFSL